ncbi:MAG: hypothetical protein IJ678_03025 [Kiritimatiellae bacterium]|nr:hypothetical protein [Kiritimatiellia bacterium]
MKFEKFGKAYHLAIETPADLKDVLALDDSFWAAVSAPTAAFREDPAFLRYVDSDGNGRMRSDEVRAALRWLLDTLADDSKIGAPDDDLDLSAVRKDSAAGPGLLVTAAYVNEQAGRNDGRIRLADVRAAMAELRGKPLNGDGILVPAAAGDDAALAEYVEAAVAATGGSDDISGAKGVSSAQLAEFAAAAKDYLEWKALGADDNAETMPFGADTPAVYNLFARHRDAVDRFFVLADFQRWDPAGAAKYLAADTASDSAATAFEAAPLARPLPDGSLPLDGPGVNPLRRDVVAALRDGLFGRVLGRTAPESVTEDDWKKVKAALAGHGAWLASKKGAIVESFPVEKLRAWADGPCAEKAAKLQEEDEVVAKRVGAFADLEKLLLFHRRLPRFLENYVSLSEFYHPDRTSLFERGRLLLDGRWFNLAIEVADPAAHSAVAKNGGLFTMYLKVEPVGGPAPFTVVVPATSGTRGNIAVGKRGVFFDLDGREYDATVVSVIEAPISLKEAILSPFQNIAKAIMGKIENLSAAAQSKIEKTGIDAADAVESGKAPVAAPAPEKAPPQGGGAAGAVGMFAGVSVAIAALGSAFAFIAKSVAAMSWTSRALALLAVLVVVFGPIVLAGVLKLMRQDMGPIIEGCGWAVNKSMRLTRKLRRQFTVTKAYPEEAEGTPARRRAAILGIVAAVVVAAVCIRAVVARCTAAPEPAAEAAAEAVEEPAAEAAAE